MTDIHIPKIQITKGVIDTLTELEKSSTPLTKDNTTTTKEIIFTIERNHNQ